MKAMWNERYQQKEFQYGTNPNEFMATQLKQFIPGRILFPGAGEGRDAVFAAKLGWESHAFDLSEQGHAKAMRLATEQKTQIHYKVADASQIKFPLDSFDVIALTFFHLPREIRLSFYQHCISWLKPGGIILLEGFTKNQLGLTSGGPKNPDWLFSSKELTKEFPGLDILINKELRRTLNEGPLHQGPAQIVQFKAQKPG